MIWLLMSLLSHGTAEVVACTRLGDVTACGVLVIVYQNALPVANDSLSLTASLNSIWTTIVLFFFLFFVCFFS